MTVHPNEDIDIEHIVIEEQVSEVQVSGDKLFEDMVSGDKLSEDMVSGDKLSDMVSDEYRYGDNAYLAVSDFLAFCLALMASHTLIAMILPASWVAHWQGLEGWADKPRLAIFFGIACVATICFWAQLGHYTYNKPFWRELNKVWRTINALALVDLAIEAVFGIAMSHMWWFLTWGAVLVAIPLMRSVTNRLLPRLGLCNKPLLIIGNGPNAVSAYNAFQSELMLGCKFAGFVSVQSDDHRHAYPHGVLPAMPDDIYSFKNAKIVFALESHQEIELDTWMRHLVQHGAVDISVIPSIKGIPLYGVDSNHFFSHEILLLRIRNNLARGCLRAYKRVFDLAAATLGLLALSPLLMYIYAKVASTGHPVIFGHERIGQGGKPFKCYKFRSMVPDAAARLAQLLLDSPAAREEWNREFKLKNDPRITPIGKFLRKTSLDELPQLWNVIKGEMSLVGPRPVVKQEIERYGENASYYYMSKPGMTGLWQVSGRNDIDYARRVYLDVWYLKNWSLWYDLTIILKTFRVIINKGGAY